MTTPTIDTAEAEAAARLAIEDSRATLRRAKTAYYYDTTPQWERDLDLTIGVLHRLSVDAGGLCRKPHYQKLEQFVAQYGTEALLGVIGRALKEDGRN